MFEHLEIAKGVKTMRNTIENTTALFAGTTWDYCGKKNELHSKGVSSVSLILSTEAMAKDELEFKQLWVGIILILLTNLLFLLVPMSILEMLATSSIILTTYINIMFVLPLILIED